MRSFNNLITKFRLRGSSSDKSSRTETAAGASANEHPFNADRPLNNPADDRLDRDPFAKELATHIGSWTGEDSITIGINGEWGSGKTTLKNFIKLHLSDRSAPPTIVEVNPWEWSAQGKLLDGFLTQIGAALGKDDKGGRYRKLAKKWRAYSDALKLVSSIAETVKTAAKTVFIASSGVIAIKLMDTDQIGVTATWITAAVLVLSAALSFIPGLVEAFANFAQSRSTWHQQSIDEIRSSLKKELLQRKSPVVVFLDDIDRLDNSEIKMLVQLIKANGQLPNLIYVVLYQRDTVEKALSDVVSGEGARYLRKIVQHSFDLPTPSITKIRGIISDDIERILFKPGIKRVRWDSSRWHDSFAEPFFSWFKNIRDAKRFIGSLEFVVKRHGVSGVLEVNAIDLVVIEALRVFHHDVYKRISEGFHRSGSFDSLLFRHDDDDLLEAFTAQIGQIVESLEGSDLEKSYLRKVLEGLFPQGSLFPQRIEKSILLEGNEENWLRDRRVCHKSQFRKYFALNVEEGDVSTSTLDLFLSTCGDRSKAFEILNKLKEDGPILEFLEAVFSSRKEIARDDLVGLTTALFDVGDNFPEVKYAFLLRELGMTAIRIIHQRLKIEEQSFAESVLREAFKETRGLLLPVRLLFRFEDEVARAKKEAGAESLIAEERVSEFQRLVLDLIHRGAVDGTLLKVSSPADVLYRWQEWEAAEAVKAWTFEVIKDPATGISLLKGLLSHSYGSGGIHELSLTAKSAESLVDLDALSASVKNASPDELDEEANQGMALLEKAIKLRDEQRQYSEVRLSDL